MDAGPAWLAHLPVDRGYMIAAWLGIVLGVALRAAVGRTASGRGLVRLLHGGESILLALLLAAMILLSFLQIVLRNVAHTGLVWIDPLLRHLLLWIGFLGATLATRLGRHISVDALSRLLPPVALRASRVATHLGAACVCVLLSNACLKAMRDEAGAGTTSFLGIPTWMLQVVMPAATLVMSYRFARHALEALLGQEPEKAALLGETRI